MQGFSEQNIERLAAVFPEVVTESRDENGSVRRAVDFERLRMLLTGEGSDAREYYAFTWAGKREAELAAMRPADGVLRPIVDESVNFANTENLYIEGDNLEAMKILRKSYMHRVKMIYIDPPYNTGKDFVYRDNFRGSAKEDRQVYMFDAEGRRNFSAGNYEANSTANPRYHSDWCSMIYPRLRVARDFLREDGVIFISIDDNEVMNLRKMCDEIFGESNFIANLVWKSKSGGANDSKFFAVDHEYIIVYAKNAGQFTLKQDTEAEVTTSYNRSDENGEYSLDRLDKQSLGYLPALDFVIIGPDGKEYRPHQKNVNSPNARWRWSKETVAQRYDELVFEDGNVYTKNYKKDGAVPRSLLIDERFGRTRTGKTDLYAIFERDIFSSPKPYKLITHLLSIATDDDSIILDFFAGSSTTAHATISLNAQDFGHRKFIMIQLPEPCPKDSEAAKAGFSTIADIGRARIVRSGQKIVASSTLPTNHSTLPTTKEEVDNDSQTLQGNDSVAESNESRQIYLFPSEETTQRRTVQPVRPDATCSSINPIEHSGRSGEIFNERVSAVPLDSERLKDGTGDTAASLRGDRLLDGTGHHGDMGAASGSGENDSRIDEQTSAPLTTNHYPTNHYYLDTGFRSLHVDTTNFRPEAFISPDEPLTPERLDASINNIKPDRSPLDLLFMCITDYGLPLSLPYKSEVFDGYTLHFYGGLTLAACFDKNISESLVVHLAKLQPEHVIFRDSCFSDSAAKINLAQLLKHYAPKAQVKIL